MESKYDFATDEEIERRRYDLVRNLKKKGYVQLVTSLGTLNLEIHCDLVPRTSENFLGLCTAGKYDNTPFHRLIPHFMVQGGDPTGFFLSFYELKAPVRAARVSGSVPLRTSSIPV